MKNSKNAEVVDDGYVFVDIAEVWQCVNCGSYAKLKEDIEHYNNCQPNESERFLKEYATDEADYGGL